MIVIADNSLLNYLIRLGQSDLLQNFSGRALLPHWSQAQPQLNNFLHRGSGRLIKKKPKKAQPVR
jgi:hypothetical protein